MPTDPYTTPDLTPEAEPQPLAQDIPSLVAKYTAKHGVPYDLGYRLVFQESGGNPNATSPKGAMGLVQFMPDTAAQVGLHNPYDPEANLDKGFQMLRQNYDKFGNWGAALVAHNAGPGRVVSGDWANEKYRGFDETRNFVRTILGPELGNQIIAKAQEKTDHPYNWPDYGGIVAPGTGQAWTMPGRTAVTREQIARSREDRLAAAMPVEMAVDPTFYRSGYDQAVKDGMIPLQAFAGPEGGVMKNGSQNLWDAIMGPLLDYLGLNRTPATGMMPWEKEFHENLWSDKPQEVYDWTYSRPDYGAETDFSQPETPSLSRVLLPGQDLQADEWKWRNRMYEQGYAESALLHEVGTVGRKAVDAMFGGLPEALREAGGRKPDEYLTTTGAVAGGVGEAAGFILGPGKAGGKLFQMLPLSGSRFLPKQAEIAAILRALGESSATMALAMPLGNLVRNLHETSNGVDLAKSLLNDARTGTLLGLAYPGAGFLTTNKAMRAVMSMVAADTITQFPQQFSSIDDLVQGMVDGTLSKREIALRVARHVTDAYFGVHQMGREDAFMRERMGNLAQDLFDIPKEEYFKAMQALGKTRDIATPLDRYQFVPQEARQGLTLEADNLITRLENQKTTGRIDSGTLTDFLHEQLALARFLTPEQQRPYVEALLAATRVSNNRTEVMDAMTEIYRDMKADLGSRAKEPDYFKTPEPPPLPSPEPEGTGEKKTAPQAEKFDWQQSWGNVQGLISNLVTPKRRWSGPGVIADINRQVRTLYEGKNFRGDLVDLTGTQPGTGKERYDPGMYVNEESRIFAGELGANLNQTEYFNTLMRHPEVIAALPQLHGKRVGYRLLDRGDLAKLEVAMAIADLPPSQFRTLLDYSRGIAEAAGAKPFEPIKPREVSAEDLGFDLQGQVVRGEDGRPQTQPIEYDALKALFSDSPEMAQKLLETGDAYIKHPVDQALGDNLMRVRTELQAEQEAKPAAERLVTPDKVMSLVGQVKPFVISDVALNYAKAVKNSALVTAKEIRQACTVPDSQFGKLASMYFTAGLGQRAADYQYIREVMEPHVQFGTGMTLDSFLEFANSVQSGREVPVWLQRPYEVYWRMSKSFWKSYEAMDPTIRGREAENYLRQMYAVDAEGNLVVAPWAKGAYDHYLSIKEPEARKAFIEELKNNPAYVKQVADRFQKRAEALDKLYEENLQKEKERQERHLPEDGVPVKASDFLHNTGYLEAKTLPDYETALLLGLSPRQTNPVMLMRNDLMQRTRWLMEAKIVSLAMKEGWVKTADAPALDALLRDNPDKVQLEGRAAQMFRSLWDDLHPESQTEAGEKMPRVFVAHKDVATLVNRLFGASLWEQGWYAGARPWIDLVRKMQVSLSAFHAVMITKNVISQGAGEGIVKALGSVFDPTTSSFDTRFEGFMSGVRRTGRAIAVIPEVKDVLGRAREQLAKYYENPDLAPYLKEYVDSGGRLPDIEAIRPFVQAWSEALGKFRSSNDPLLKQIEDTVAWPIMTYYVPLVKLGSFLKMREIVREEVDARFAKLPDGPDTQAARDREYLYQTQKIHEHLDNIHGQMVYDNMPLSRALRDGLFIGMNYPGWSIGSYRWMYHAFRGAWNLIKGEGFPEFKNDAQARHAMTYMMGMLAQMATYNTLMNVFLTGEAPDWKDVMIGPRTGRIMNNGAAERLRTAGYDREVLEAVTIMDPRNWASGKSYRELANLAASKELFVLKQLTELARNVDYFGNEIIDQDASAPYQLYQGAKYLGKSLIPISMRPILAALGLGGSAAGMGKSPFVRYGGPFGVSRVPKHLVGGELTDQMDRYFESTAGRMLLEKDQPKRDLKDAVMEQMDANDIAGAQQTMVEALSKGVIDSRQFHNLQKDIQLHLGDPLHGPMRVRFNKVNDLEAAIKIYGKGDAVEKNTLQPIMMQKWASATPEAKAKNYQQFLEVLRNDRAQ